MANFHDENKFNLKQDWNWDKIIFGSDEHIYQQAYENALIGGDTSLILSPDSEFFKFFGNIKPKTQ